MIDFGMRIKDTVLNLQYSKMATSPYSCTIMVKKKAEKTTTQMKIPNDEIVTRANDIQLESKQNQITGRGTAMIRRGQCIPASMKSQYD